MKRADVVEMVRPICAANGINPEYVQEVMFTVNGWYIQYFDTTTARVVRLSGWWDK